MKYSLPLILSFQLQFYAFNFVLYPNISTAVPSPNGLAGLSVFMKVSTSINISKDVFRLSLHSCCFLKICLSLVFLSSVITVRLLDANIMEGIR